MKIKAKENDANDILQCRTVTQQRPTVKQSAS